MTQLSKRTQTTPQTVSVIICCYTMERFKDVHEAVQSVLAQSLKPYEVIVAVDHNEELYESLQSLAHGLQSHPASSAPQATELRTSNFKPRTLNVEPQVKVVLNTGVQGLSETRNVGIRAANGDIVAFIDDDAVAEKDWLKNLTRHFHNSRVVAVGGRAIPLWLSGSRPSWFPEELDWIVGCTYKGLPVKTLNLEPRTSNLELRTIRNVPGCNMAFRREVFEQVGLFRSEMGGIKETPRGGEEAELCLRIKHKFPDSLILYQPNAVIHHKVPSWRLSLKYLTQRSYNEGFYKAKVQKLHQPTPKMQQRRTLNVERQTLNLERRTMNQTLSTENSYLHYLLFASIPERLKRFYKKGSLSQAGAIMISIVATGAGYFMGKLKT